MAALLHDHDLIRRNLVELRQAPVEHRAVALARLVGLLASHEKAEEVVVYPALRACAAGGRAIAEDRVAEQLAAEHHLQDVERAGPEDRWFASAVAALEAEVERHAEAEERTVFWVLDANLGRRRLDALRGEYLRARRRGPTHPHPLSPHKSRAAAVAAPVAGAVDRLGDALTGGRCNGGRA